MIIVVGGIKGGTGKTTIATNFAVISCHMGKRVLLVDADEQESASDWAEQRDNYWQCRLERRDDWQYAGFPTVKLGGKLLYEQLKRFRSNYDDIVVDTGGRDTTSQRSALLIADCYIVPFKPRSLDVWTMGKVKSMMDAVAFNKNLKVFVCINQGDHRGTDNEEVFKILEENPDWKLISFSIGQRKAFANAATLGLGVMELDKNMKDSKACEEMKAIYDVIYSGYMQDI